MLLNEPSHHSTRPAAASAAAVPGNGAPSQGSDGPAVEIDGAQVPSRASAEADTVSFVAMDAEADTEVEADTKVDADVRADGDAGSEGSGGTEGSAGEDASPASDAMSTVALDVEAVRRAVAQAPTVAFSPIDPSTIADEDEISTLDLAEDEHSPSAEIVPAAESDVAASEDDADATSSYLASTLLTTPPSTVVAVPETADDVIATIHAAATAVARADRRARQAAVVKEDPWTGLDLHQPAAPAPVGDVLDLLAPVLERPILVVEQPGLPAAADVVALHRAELEAEFVEAPVVAAGAEPPIPPRYGPGLSVLPHIEFPV
jgi:hypothetical protein